MGSEKTRKFMVPAFIILAVIICGLMGYLNSRGVKPDEQALTMTLQAGKPTPESLTYCRETGKLCITSFGVDNSGNMLIIISHLQAVTSDIYAKISMDGGENRYTCKEIEFNPGTFYCIGDQIPDGSLATLSVYAKEDDTLLANGEMVVQFGSTPVASTGGSTPTVIAAIPPTETSRSTPTPMPATQIPTVSYPNPGTAYPNPTSNNSRGYP